MAYIPPLNGGRINASFAGNTAGASMLVSTGTMVLAGGNNVTLSQTTGANGATISINAAGGAQSLGLYGAGNTTQNSSTTVDARSVSLNGLGGLTVGYSGGSVQLSAPIVSSVSATGALSISTNGGTVSMGVPAFSAGISTIGNTAGTSGTASNQVVFAGGNNIMLSQATGAGGNTITISASNQTAQTQSNIQAIYDGVNSISTGTIRFSNSNGISFGIAAQVLTASHNGITSQTAQTIGMYATGVNTTGQSSSNTLDARSFSISAQGGLYAGMSGNTLQLSAATTYAASNHSHGNPTLNLTNLSGTTASASNGLTLSLSAAAQTNQNLALSAVGNTTQTSTGTMNATNMYFSGAGNVSIGYSNGSAIISGGGGGGGAGLSAGTQSVNTGTVSFANSNGISFGMSGSNQITATVATNYAASNHSHGNPTLNLTNLSGTTASASNGFTLSLSAAAPGAGGGIALNGGGTTYTSGTVNLSGAGALTITNSTAGGGGQTYQLSVPSVSSLNQAGIVNISTAGAGITISAPAFSAGVSNLGNTSGNTGTVSNQIVIVGTNGIGLSQSTAAGGATISINGGPYLSRWEYPEGIFSPLSTQGQGSLSINHMYVPFNVTGSAMKIGGSLSAATNTSVTTASANVSLWMGIYTLNGSTLSLASSGSANTAFQWSVSNSSTANTSINSMRQMTVPMNINMTPGQYWVAAVMSSATTYTSFAYTLYGNSVMPTVSAGAVLTPIGSNTSANRDAMLFQGIYTANTSAGPVSMANTDINNTSASYVMRANFYNVIFNATY